MKILLSKQIISSCSTTPCMLLDDDEKKPQRYFFSLVSFSKLNFVSVMVASFPH
jgi:hypothetical protein